MRLVDADELLEHAWKDKLDSRELIAEMISSAPTVKEIPTTIPINIFERLLASNRKRGKWIIHYDDLYPAESTIECSVCREEQYYAIDNNFCPNCGADMRGDEKE